MASFESKTPVRGSGRARRSAHRPGARRLRQIAARLRDAGAARPSLTAATIYAILAVAMFGQGLLPGRVLSSSDQLWTVAPWSSSAPQLSRSTGSNYELNDAANVFQPFLEYTQERLPHVPLWNPHIMAGRPFLANAQSAVLSPFSFPSYVLPDRVSFVIAAALKLFVAAFGTFLLARALGLGFAGALLAGLVYGFGQLTVDSVTWPHDSIRVLLPWLLLLVERLMQRPRALPVAGLATVVALVFFGGHPETSYNVMLATVAFALFRLAELRRTGRAVWRPALAAPVAVAAGTALAAIVIVPFVELLLHSSDLESRKLLSGFQVSPDYLLGLLLPTYWGRPTQTAGVLVGGQMITRAFYAGALPLMLAAAALIRPSIRRVALAVVGLGTLAVVVGFEPFQSIAEAFPGPVRTDRLTFLFLFAVALLAGRGLDDMVAARLGATRRKVLLGLSVTLACFPLVYVAAVEWSSFEHLDAALTLAWGFHIPTEAFAEGSRGVVRVGALLEWLPFAAAGAALLAVRASRKLVAPAFATIAIALTAADLFKLGVGYNPAVTTAQAFQPTTGAIRYLQQAGLARFAGVDRGFLGSFPPDVAVRYGLYTARGRDYPVIDRYTTLWSRNIAPVLPDPRFALPPPDDRALRALGLMSVAYLMQDSNDPMLNEPALNLVYDERDARIYRNRHALPRAFVVDRQRVAATDGRALEAVESRAFDGRTTAITEEPVPGVSTSGAPGGARAGSASITSYAPEKVVVRARAARPSLLVLTDSYFPGWEAEVDGNPATVHRADYLFRGIRLPAGEHRVTFSYRPISYRLGWVISVLALLAILATAFVGWRRRHVPG